MMLCTNWLFVMLDKYYHHKVKNCYPYCYSNLLCLQKIHMMLEELKNTASHSHRRHYTNPSTYVVHSNCSLTRNAVPHSRHAQE